MKEKDFQTTFSHWLKSVHRKTGAFELKKAKGDSLPFDSVVPHQVLALRNAKHGVLAYKIPDVGYQNPFDCMCLAGTEAFVVVKYQDFFCLIDIDSWTEEAKTSERKSLVSDRAKQIAHIVVGN